MRASESEVSIRAGRVPSFSSWEILPALLMDSARSRINVAGSDTSRRSSISGLFFLIIAGAQTAERVLEHDDRCESEKQQCGWRSVEDRWIVAGHDHRCAELAFHGRSEHQSEQDRRQRD